MTAAIDRAAFQVLTVTPETCTDDNVSPASAVPLAQANTTTSKAFRLPRLWEVGAARV